MMKKKQFLLKLAFLLIPFITFSQNFTGFSYDNYGGVQRLSLNPAYVVDSPYHFDFNIAGATIFTSNDYAVIDFGDKIIKGKFDEIDDSIFSVIDSAVGSTGNNLNINTEILGPSFMFNLNKDNAFGVFTKARSVISVMDINVNAYDRFINDGFDTNEDYSLDISNSAISTHLWGEVGLTYGRVFSRTDHSLFKGGGSIKYIQGGGNAFIAFKNTVINYHGDSGLIDTTGELSYGTSFNIDEAVDGNGFSNYFDGEANGIGFDIGAVYQWSSQIKEEDSETKKQPKFYKYRLAVSITDIGKINYPTGELIKYNLNQVDINPDELEGDDFFTVMDELYGDDKISDNKLVVQLPTAAHLNFDYSITDHIYVNINGDFALTDIGNNASKVVSNYLITPRYESKWISAYIPINYDTYKNMAMGIGVRLGPVFVGSNTALSALFTPIRKADVHFGLKIPIYKKTKKQLARKQEKAAEKLKKKEQKKLDKETKKVSKALEKETNENKD